MSRTCSAEDECGRHVLVVVVVCRQKERKKLKKKKKSERALGFLYTTSARGSASQPAVSVTDAVRTSVSLGRGEGAGRH